MKEVFNGWVGRGINRVYDFNDREDQARYVLYYVAITSGFCGLYVGRKVYILGLCYRESFIKNPFFFKFTYSIKNCH